MSLVYGELRKLAAEKSAHENSDHALEPTALVHEAYMRLVDTTEAPAQRWSSNMMRIGLFRIWPPPDS